MKNEQKVIDYYDKTLADYRFIYFREDDHSMHYGYWDEKTNGHVESLLRLNQVITEKLDLTKEDIVLYAGCGFGETAFWLANNLGCRVEAISLTEDQIQRAKKLAV